MALRDPLEHVYDGQYDVAQVRRRLSQRQIVTTFKHLGVTQSLHE